MGTRLQPFTTNELRRHTQGQPVWLRMRTTRHRRNQNACFTTITLSAGRLPSAARSFAVCGKWVTRKFQYVREVGDWSPTSTMSGCDQPSNPHCKSKPPTRMSRRHAATHICQFKSTSRGPSAPHNVLQASSHRVAHLVEPFCVLMHARPRTRKTYTMKVNPQLTGRPAAFSLAWKSLARQRGEGRRRNPIAMLLTRRKFVPTVFHRAAIWDSARKLCCGRGV